MVGITRIARTIVTTRDWDLVGALGPLEPSLNGIHIQWKLCVLIVRRIECEFVKNVSKSET